MHAAVTLSFEHLKFPFPQDVTLVFFLCPFQMTSSIEQWNMAFAVISIIVALFAFIIPLPSRKVRMTRHFWAWMWVRFVSFICIWYVLYVVGTSLAFSLGIVHEGDDDLGTVEMYASIVFAVLAVIFTFFGVYAWSFVLAAVVSSMISKFLPIDAVVHQAVMPLFFFVVIIALCYLLRTHVARFIAYMQVSLGISADIVFASLYLNSGAHLWLSTNTVDNLIIILAIAIGTGIKLLYDSIYAYCVKCRGGYTVVDDPLSDLEDEPDEKDGKKKKSSKDKKKKKTKQKTSPDSKSTQSDSDESEVELATSK